MEKKKYLKKRNVDEIEILKKNNEMLEKEIYFLKMLEKKKYLEKKIKC